MSGASGRFWSKVRKAGADDCWLWTRSTTTHGYGQFWLNGANHNASRIAWVLTHGTIEGGLVVCHRCDNRRCCNPAHLFLGTQGDNVRDCCAKGRGAGQFASGNRHPRHNAKLTEEAVRTARVLHYENGVTQAEIAKRLGVDNSSISRALRGDMWSHVE